MASTDESSPITKDDGIENPAKPDDDEPKDSDAGSPKDDLEPTDNTTAAPPQPAVATAPLEMLANESDALRRAQEESKEMSQSVKIIHLQHEVKKLEAKIRRLKKEHKVKDEKILELSEELEWFDEDKVEQMKKRKEDFQKKEEEEKQPIPEDTVWRFFFKFAGFSRFSLLSDEWHTANPAAANQLFGFRTWEEAKQAVREKFPSLQMKPPLIYKVFNKQGELDLELRECSAYEQCFAVKMMDRTGLTARRMALLYGRDKRAVTKWKKKWVPKWGFPTNTGSDDEDGIDSGNKRKAGTSRPFQSRQMIHPLKRRKAAPPPAPPVTEPGGPPDVAPPTIPLPPPPPAVAAAAAGDGSDSEPDMDEAPTLGEATGVPEPAVGGGDAPLVPPLGLGGQAAGIQQQMGAAGQFAPQLDTPGMPTAQNLQDFAAAATATNPLGMGAAPHLQDHQFAMAAVGTGGTNGPNLQELAATMAGPSGPNLQELANSLAAPNAPNLQDLANTLAGPNTLTGMQAAQNTFTGQNALGGANGLTGTAGPNLQDLAMAAPMAGAAPNLQDLFDYLPQSVKRPRYPRGFY